MYVPANYNSFVEGYSTTDPTIVRMGSIPHGVNVLMQGTAPSATPVPGPPVIPDTYPNPSIPCDPDQASAPIPHRPWNSRRRRPRDPAVHER